MSAKAILKGIEGISDGLEARATLGRSARDPAFKRLHDRLDIIRFAKELDPMAFGALEETVEKEMTEQIRITHKIHAALREYGK